jgi:CP family cyanate transporter-like MFS transporter
LLPEIQDDLGISHAVAGLLGTIPVLCMGLFAPPAARVLVRLGSRNAIAACVLVMAAFGVARALVPPAALVILLTFGVGIGMGLLGAMMPIAVKERFADRPAFGTGVYALGINIGAGLSAATAVPLADATWGWRGSLTVFSVATGLLAVVWLVLTRGARADSVTPMKPAPLPWRSGLAWLFVTIFVLMAVLYYGVNTWLPDTYVERGWSEEDAAWLVAVLNVTALPWTIAFAWIADRIGSRRLYLVGGSAISAIAMLGFILWPEGGFLWAVVLGVAAGAMFPLAMTLPLDVTDDPARVGAVAGMMLGVGYGLGALSPLILGGLRDATGSFTASLWMIAAATIAITVLCLFLTRQRLERGVQFEA